MDHVSANKSLPVTERENISGVRVLDGEDQGRCKQRYFSSMDFIFILFYAQIKS